MGSPQTPTTPGTMGEHEWQPGLPGREIPLKPLQLGTPLIYITRDDRLFVRFANTTVSSNLRLEYRLLRPDGQVIVGERDVTITQSTNYVILNFDVTEGYLLSLTLRAINQSAAIVYFVQAGIFRGNAADPYMPDLLISGYLIRNELLGWPYSRLRTPYEQPAPMLIETPASPGAGADFVYTVSANTRKRVISMSLQLVTSAAVATRDVTIFVDDGVHVVYEFTDPTTQLASTTLQYEVTDIGALSVAAAGTQVIPLPRNFILQQGWRVRTSTANIQVGDQWTVNGVAVEFFIDA